MSRALPDSAWIRGYFVQPADMITIDQNTYKALTPNGDTWNPAAPIVIGGAGLGVGCKLDLDNANTSVLTSPTNRITLSRLDRDDVLGFLGSPGYVQWQYQAPPMAAIARDDETIWGAISSGVPTREEIASRRPFVRFAWRLRVHNGATLYQASIVFYVVVDRSASGVPASLPAIRVIRVDRTGKIESLKAQDANTDSSGFYTFNPRPSTGDNYDQGGAAQTFTITPDQNNVVDTSLYDYFFEVREESGRDNVLGGGQNNWAGPIATFRTTRFEPA